MRDENKTYQMEKRRYTAPEVVDCGSVTDTTAVFGAATQFDICINTAGAVLNKGNLSLDV